MNDEMMKKLKKFEEDLRNPEEELEDIQWFLTRFEYARAAEAADAFEQQYTKLMQTADMEEIQCRFWILKLEILTGGFQSMELSRQEEEVVTGLYRKLIRMNRLPIRGMRYLFQREEYLRIQKKLDHLERRKLMNGMFLGATCSMMILAIVLGGLSICFGIISETTVSVVLVLFGIAWTIWLLLEIMFYKMSYSRWQEFLLHPVPFEYSDLF